jgi:hypothetical protein
MRRIIGTGVVLLFLGCSYRPDPVPIVASTGAVSLVGTWLGEYHGTESGRSGSITFIIAASGDSAYGDVLMVSATNPGVIRAAHPPEEHMAHVRSAQALRIDLVAISGGEVSGRMEPYIAPDCNCQVTTTFTGRPSGDVIEGTFVTRGANLEQHGRWRVTRSR